eukprot:scaffold6350_cov117-Cylindrotheca_fusiformis.AAC.1
MGSNHDENDHLTILDRSVSIILKDATRSAQQGISPSVERLHRMHGTSLIYDASQLLSLGTSTYATACTMFHRFFHQCSLLEYDVWSVAMASTLLAAKVEEAPQSIKALIRVYSHLYRKRILLATTESPEQVEKHPLGASLPEATKWTLAEKELRLSKSPLPSQMGPVYSTWHDKISKTEAQLLRQLGVLELTDSMFAQRAWDYCNDSCRLDLCVRFSAETIACSSILLTAWDMNVILPLKPRPWWETFIGRTKSADLAAAANFIVGLRKMSDTEPANQDLMLANMGFVQSILPETDNGRSFNDRESFLWDHQKEVVAQNDD